MNPGRAVPSPHRAVSGARSFLMNRTPAPQTAADADGACGLHVQRHATAANDRSRLVFRTSDRCTYARDKNRILSRDPNISRFRPASIPESARESVFPFQNAYFSNMYKFAVQVSPGRRRKKCRNRPGCVRHLDFTSARSRKNEAESRRLSAFFSLIRKSSERRGCIPAPGVVY